MSEELPTLAEDESKLIVPPPFTSKALASQQLSIMHLLVWMGLIAVCLGIERRVWERPLEEIPLDAWQFQYAIISATGVGSLIIYWQRRIHHIAFPTEPGEWMLIVIGLQYVLTPLVDRIVTAHFEDDRKVAILATTILQALPMLLPIVYSRDLTLRVYFVVRIAIEFAQFYLIIMPSSSYTDYTRALNFAFGIRLIPLGMLVWFTWRDYVDSQSRGWLHWLGIAASAAPYLIGLRTYVAWVLS